MNKKYSRSSYGGNSGYIITHTIGESAEDSTLGYPHRTPEYMVYYFIQGSGNIKIEGRNYDIEKGDIIILNPSELFCCSVDNGIFHERIVLHINETILKNFPCEGNSLFIPFYKRKKGEVNKIPAQTVQEHKLDIDLMKLLELAKMPDTTSVVLSVCKAVEILAKLSEVITPSFEGGSEQIRTHPLINDVLSYLNTHFEEDLNISFVAETFNIDKSYLSHLFKEYVGIPLWTYVILRRIYLFNDLIRENHSIEETCYRVGFQNYSNFFRLYKKYMKMTPTQFKKQIKSEIMQNPVGI